MTSAPIAHVGGIPIEETLAALGPPLLVAFGVASEQLRARLRRMRSRANAHALGAKTGAQCRRAALNTNSDDERVALPQARHYLGPPSRRAHAESATAATPPLLAAHASISTCVEFTTAEDDKHVRRSRLLA